ncbi:MAG: glycerate kinase [Saprospiraceae bacterium]
MMNILICPDKFKGSLSAMEVCQAIGKGIRARYPEAAITFHPMADGGDGSLQILAHQLGLRSKELETTDPLGRKIRASYYYAADTAFIELASASGLVLLTPAERNALATSTFGTGQMMVDAIQSGFRNIYLFLGGSATNDAGMGIMAALGFEFLSQEGNVLSPIGAHLPQIAQIRNRSSIDFSQVQITLLCDVTNPLYGPDGAAYVYARQKGATDEEIVWLDHALQHIGQIIFHYTGVDTSYLPGTGAAGGVGASLVALCGAKIERGFATIAELTGLPARIHASDWVISGEGRLDSQSLQGKVVDGVASLCRQYHKPLTLLVGKNELLVMK